MGLFNRVDLIKTGAYNAGMIARAENYRGPSEEASPTLSIVPDQAVPENDAPQKLPKYETFTNEKGETGPVLLKEEVDYGTLTIFLSTNKKSPNLTGRPDGQDVERINRENRASRSK